MILTIDFETRSKADLRKVGLYNYAEDPSTEIQCLAVKVDCQSSMVWVPMEVQDQYLALGGLTDTDVKSLVKSADKIYAHNAAFELQIWNNIMVKCHDFEPLDVNKVYCTAAMASVCALPRGLKGACIATDSPIAKDAEGHKLMLRMCKPRAPTVKEMKDPNWRKRVYYHDTFDEMKGLIQYCKNDTDSEYELMKRLPQLSEKERELWLLDYKINCRGVYVDLDAIGCIQAALYRRESILTQKIAWITDGKITSVRQVQRTLRWLEEHGLLLSNLQKLTVTNALKSDIPDEARKLLEIRVQLGKSSTAKFDKIVATVSADSRVRGMFLYHGATTGRWTGKGVQLQNLPRGNLGKLAVNAIEDFSKLSLEEFQLSYGDYFSTASGCIRSIFCASEGKTLVCADFSSIEARVLAWIADEEDVLEIFEKGNDLYKITAARLFDIKYEDVTKLQRTIGKVTTLALGYAGGIGAFSSMAKNYGMDLSTLPTLIKDRVTMDMVANAKKIAAMYNKNATEPLPLADAVSCDLVKQLWRSRREKVVNLWHDVERAAVRAVLIGGPQSVSKVVFEPAGSWLRCLLPSGRYLYYPYPAVESNVTKWEMVKEQTLSYWTTVNSAAGWVKRYSYGGMLVENIVQAIARDLLAEAMLNADKEDNYELILHVHDEIAVEANEGWRHDHLTKLLCRTPDWAIGLPLAAEGWHGKRYRK